jgi:hypothetical protein
METQLVLGEAPPPVIPAPVVKKPCPHCGHELRDVLTLFGPMYFVDEQCDYCDYVNLDQEGGV